MTYQVFDLLYTDPDQAREFLLAMVKEGLVGGVYLWINRVNSKMYVGSSLNLYSRISGYLRLSKLHGVIGPALLKYGLDSFVLVIFLIPNATSSLVLALEQSVLDGCVCAYNISPTAGSSAGVKRSEETKAKISDSMKGNTNSKGRELSDGISSVVESAKKGTKHSALTKAKISDSKKGKTRSEESKAKISASSKGQVNYNKGYPVYLYLIHAHGLELAASFPNLVRCSETLGVPYQTLVKRIKNRTLFEVNGLQHVVSRDGNLARL